MDNQKCIKKLLTYVFYSIRISLNLKLNIRQRPSGNSCSPPLAGGDRGEGDHPHLHPPPSRGRRLIVVFPDER
jgi:hypothetical protein